MHPDRRWTIVARRMWIWTKRCWQDGWWDYGDITPDVILNSADYNAFRSNHRGIGRKKFEQLAALYRGISDGSEADELVRTLNIPFRLGYICDAEDYRDAVGEAQTMEAIAAIEEILKGHHIERPDVSQISAFIKKDPLGPARCEALGICDRSGKWGMGIDAAHLSIILKKRDEHGTQRDS